MAVKTGTRTVALKAWSLKMQTGGHNKFYDVYAGEDGTLVLHWGRIGTSGQVKVEMHTQQEAENLAMRQVYSKASKGYVLGVDAVEFPVADALVENLRMYGTGMVRIQRALAEHMGSDAFKAQQKLATAHYDKFIEGANQVLDSAAQGADIEDLLAQWTALGEAWKELDDRHSMAAASVSLVQQTVQQKLMGG